MIDSVSKAECVGCKACADICPKNAIRFETDQEGFWYPAIDAVKCINCNVCERACPAIHEANIRNSREDIKVYDTCNKDREIRYRSTSGGLYYALADTILKKNGSIIGCAFTENYESACHIVSNDDSGLERIMRSKYFQSDTGGIFQKTKILLQEGQDVLFAGTPCQISALYNFLGKEYERLYTVDFVCRGINSPMVYRKFLEELKKKYGSEVKDVHFKNKRRGWVNLGTRVEFKNGKVYERNLVTDPWVNGFITGSFYMRPSCAECKYKKLPRVGDITMGDFWGIKYSAEEEKLGLSLAVINNAKGNLLFEQSKNSLNSRERSIELAVEGNPAMLSSADFSQRRAEFFERIQRETYSNVVWSMLNKKWPKWRIAGISHYCKDQLRKLKRKVLQD